MKELELNDKVYKFYNGRYEGGVNLVVQVDDEGYGIIPTDCKINGVEPTVENTSVEHFPKSGEVFITGVGWITIHKATPELKDKVEKYNTRMILTDQLCDILGVGFRDKERMKKQLLTRTTKQLFAILLILIDKADGKRGICGIKENGILENDFFIPEELVNAVKEPTDDCE